MSGRKIVARACQRCGRPLSRLALFRSSQPIEVAGDAPPRRPPLYCRPCLEVVDGE